MRGERLNISTATGPSSETRPRGQEFYVFRRWLTSYCFDADLEASSCLNFGTRPPASRISSTFGGRAVHGIPTPDGSRTSPRARSSSIVSPAFTRLRSPSHSMVGRPRLIAFRKKIRANEFARIAEMPRALRATGACSRLEPQPKFTPATIMSPSWTLFAQVGSTVSNACSANTLASVVPRYLPAMMWSVEMSSPKVQTRPRKRVCRSYTFRGSVISPWIADAVTVHGLARYTWAWGDPIRPG